ncbi:MAG: glycosyl hydrolase [Kiritimatiellia bacterium]
MNRLAFALGGAVLLFPVLAVSEVAAPGVDDGACFSRFADPPLAARPWCYWFLTNTLTDRETIAEEFADIARLGFGGMLVTDSRGYHVDDEHLLVPPPTMQWGGDAWLDLFAHAVREAARNKLTFSLNIAASGGHLRGDVDVGADNPKFLMCRNYLPGDAFEAPAIPHYREVAVFAIRTAEAAARSDWAHAGDGYYTMAATSGTRVDGGSGFVTRRALEVRELKSAADGAALTEGWTIVRFGAGTLKGQEVDIDVLDRTAVCRHLERVVGRLIARVPDLVGRDKTFANLYNVSWEGAMPTWSATFEEDFAAAEGYAVRPFLPALAGFELAAKPTDAVMCDFRHARGVMMGEHLYGTVRAWAQAHGMGAFSESGGPWQRNPQTFGECDMLEFLFHNDFPQGEFWPVAENGRSPAAGHANANGRFIAKGVVSAAHVFDRRIASVEAFTHMHRHWSVDPAFLKPLGDQAFADGVNLLVWHTYTSSPLKYGTPGIEYFAGAHINRNVTWHDEFPAMVTYLARCQSLLQAGEPVTDIAVLTGDRAYTHWGTQKNTRFRNLVSDEMPVRIPRGYAYDTVNDAALRRNPDLLKRYRVVYDARPAANRTGTVPVAGLPPDVETVSDFTWCHRRLGQDDVYFIAGEGAADLVFRAAAPAVEIWDAVTATRVAAKAVTQADGRTRLALDLPVGGSRFVVFRQTTPDGPAPEPAKRPPLNLRVAGPWTVSFAYHKYVKAAAPAPVKLDELVDFSTRDDLRHFAGTATYRTTFDFAADKPASLTLSLGKVPTGLARVYVNGSDCGTVWCAPWEAEIAPAVRAGANELEIRYVNNWYNRLVGDCFLDEAARVTRSNLHYWKGERKPPAGGPAWKIRPTVYSGYTTADPLQSAGLLGPIDIR